MIFQVIKVKAVPGKSQKEDKNGDETDTNPIPVINFCFWLMNSSQSKNGQDNSESSGD